MPYDLKDGSLIVLKVRSANQESRSKDYGYKRNSRAEGLPAKITKLELVEHTKTQISFKWNEQSNVEVFLNSVRIAVSTNSTGFVHKIESGSSAPLYFQVRSINACGIGHFSP